MLLAHHPINIDTESCKQFCGATTQKKLYWMEQLLKISIPGPAPIQATDLNTNPEVLLSWLQELLDGKHIKYQRSPKQKLSKRLPPTMTKARNLVKAGKEVFAKWNADRKTDGWIAAMKDVKCCPDQIDERMMVCKGCDQQLFKDGKERCASLTEDGKTVKEGCGCYLGKKRALAGVSCPQDKWAEVDAKYEKQIDTSAQQRTVDEVTGDRQQSPSDPAV